VSAERKTAFPAVASVDAIPSTASLPSPRCKAVRRLRV
jgi:hypothetical protein